MLKASVKVIIPIWTLTLLIGCNAVKRVPDGKRLLTDNKIYQDSTLKKEGELYNLLKQQPNRKILGIPLALHFYNLARPNRDSIYLTWMQNNPEALERRNKLLSEKQTIRLGRSLIAFNRWIKSTGEPPAIVEQEKVLDSRERLRKWYWNHGWFNAEVRHDLIKYEDKRADVHYLIDPGKPYVNGELKVDIASQAIDSLYRLHRFNSFIRKDKQYNTADFTQEQGRLTAVFRNSGAFHLQREDIVFEGDTINTGHTVNATLIIKDRLVEENDTTYLTPFKIHKISRVNVFVDNTLELNPEQNRDTVLYEDFYIIRQGKRRYREEIFSDAIFIHPGDVYSDLARDRTYSRIAGLNSFEYPNIIYREDPDDPTGTLLIADILLQSKEKLGLDFSQEFTHNNIQTFGIGLTTSLMVRNVFKGSETLSLGFSGNVGASSNPAAGDNRFFDLQEIGANLGLTFPRLFVPFEMDNIIPKYMNPQTDIRISLTSQTNIGLDKQSVNGSMDYQWRPSDITTSSFSLLNAQYVRNLDPTDFYTVFNSTYDRLNAVARELGITNSTYVNEENNLTIPVGTSRFTRDVIESNLPASPEQRQTVRNIDERRERLTEDNLILSSSFTWERNSQRGIYDQEFSRFRARLEVAGNSAALIASLANVERSEDGRRNLFGVAFSQYVKPELSYTKRWALGRGNILAVRAAGGVAIPYGNSDNIPFIRSFFGGGPNDNRAWQAYALGPGSTGGLNDFNEANMKLAFNVEYRYPLLGALEGALFVDVGNIWNVLDSEERPEAVFEGLEDLDELAIGSGFGLRYNFGFFILRTDLGFKTYQPSLPEGDRWFKNYNFKNTVFNVGINYPF